METIKKEVRAKIIEVCPEIKYLPPFPYNPEAAKAIVALEKIAVKTLWNETIENFATLMAENYRRQTEADYIAFLQNVYPGKDISLSHVLRAIEENGLDDEVSYIKIFQKLISNRGGIWNLTKDLYGQSDEVWDFLYSILINK